MKNQEEIMLHQSHHPFLNSSERIEPRFFAHLLSASLLALCFALTVPGLAQAKPANPHPGQQSEPSPAVRWGPVLGIMQSDAASLQWATNVPMSCAVELDGVVATPTTARGIYHAARLTGLKQDSAYKARIVMTAPKKQKTFSASFGFRTPPKALKNWTFLAFGDTRTNHDAHGKIIQTLLKVFPRPEFLIHTGDLTENGTLPALWDRFFEIERPVLERMPFLAVCGNHEQRGPTYFGMFSNPLSQGNRPCSWYSFRYGNAVFLVLDPKDRFSEQTGFIDRVLSAADRDGVKWRIVACHYPVFSSGPHGNNQQEIDNWAPLFEKYHVQLAFFGHDHLYERNVKEPVTYLTLGGGGAPLYQPKQGLNPYSVKLLSILHLARITVSETALSVSVIGLDGNPIDSFTIK